MFIKDLIDKRHKFYLCFTKINSDGDFSCHLYNTIENVTYMGSDKIKSKTTRVINFEYDIVIPIRETVYNDILNMYFVEVLSLGVNGMLKKYNLEEHGI